MLKEEKNVYAFLIKKHFYMMDQAQNSTTFSNCQATYRKKLFLLFKKPGNFFSHRPDPPFPVCFYSVFKEPSPPLTTNVPSECPLSLIYYSKNNSAIMHCLF